MNFIHNYIVFLNNAIMNKRYTKPNLEEIVYRQLENFNAIHDLLDIVRPTSGFKPNRKTYVSSSKCNS